MSVGSIPRKLTTDQPWDNLEDASHQLGHALRKDFVGWLDRPKPLEDRLLELEEVDPRAHAAVTLKRQRRTREQIAARLGVSVATVGRLLATGQSFLLAPIRDRQDKAARLAMLEITDWQAHSIYCMRYGGYSMEQCALLLDIPLSTAKDALRKAEKFVGTHDHRVMRRYARALIAGLRESA